MKYSGFNKKPVKYAGLPYIYRGMLRCAECDCSITPEKHKGHVYYHCTQFKGKHGAAWLREEKITAQLAGFFEKIEIPEEIFETLAANLNKASKSAVDFKTQQYNKLLRERSEATQMLDNLYMDKLKGRINDEQYDKFHGTLKGKLEEV